MRINAKTVTLSGLLAVCAAAGGASAGAAAAEGTTSTTNGAPAGAPGVNFTAVPLSGPARPHRCSDTATTNGSGNLPNISECGSSAGFDSFYVKGAPDGTFWKGWLWDTHSDHWRSYGEGFRSAKSGIVLLDTSVALTTIMHAQTASGGGIRATEPGH